MNIEVFIFTLSLLTTTAYPLYRDAQWSSAEVNQAREKTTLSKDTDVVWKSHVENRNLYFQEGGDTNPLVGEIQRKLNLESERLRARLRHELSELRKRLSPLSLSPLSPYPAPAAPHSSPAGVRERLAPLSRQIQSVVALVGGSTQETCAQLRIYLLSLEGGAESQPAMGAGPAGRHREAVQWIGQRLEENRVKTDAAIQDFQAETAGVIQELRGGAEGAGGFLEDLSARLGQEVRSLRQEAAGRVGALKAELAGVLVSGRGALRAEGLAGLDRYCQSTARENQLFQSRIEGLVLGQGEGEGGEEERDSSSSPAGGGVVVSLQDDFSARLSALLQDIKDSLPAGTPEHA